MSGLSHDTLLWCFVGPLYWNTLEGTKTKAEHNNCISCCRESPLHLERVYEQQEEKEHRPGEA